MSAENWFDPGKEIHMSLENTMNQQVQKVIAEHWGAIQKVFQEKVGPAALKAAQNDKACEALFVIAYKQLPLPVRLVIKKDVFVQYCFENRDKLLPA